LAFFIAMETIVSAHADTAGPVPQEIARKTTWKPVIDAQKPIIDSDTRGKALTSITQTSLGERVNFYLDRTGLPAPLYDQFRIARDRRNAVIHGNVTDVQMSDASGPEQLAAAILKHEMGLLGAMSWESHPRSLITTLNWQYAPRAGPAETTEAQAPPSQYQKISFHMDLTKDDSQQAEHIAEDPR